MKHLICIALLLSQAACSSTPRRLEALEQNLEVQTARITLLLEAVQLEHETLLEHQKSLEALERHASQVGNPKPSPEEFAELDAIVRENEPCPPGTPDPGLDAFDVNNPCGKSP